MANGTDAPYYIANPESQPGPATAADLADIAPAPSALDTLLPAAYGDQGAQDYQNLQQAGQTAPTPTLQMPTPSAPGGAAPGADPAAGNLAALVGGAGGLAALTGGAPGGGVPTPNINPLGAALMGFATSDPAAGAKLFAQRQQQMIAVQREVRANAVEFYTQLMPSAFKQFPGRPDLAAAFLLNEAHQRGLQVNPAVLVKMNQDMIDGKMSPATLRNAISGGDVNTIMRLGTTSKTIDEIAEADAKAREAVAKSTVAEAAATPEAIQATRSTAALRVANEMRQAQRPPTPVELDTLKAGGMIATQVPVPGVPGGYMYSTRPDDGTKKPGDIDVEALHKGQAEKAAREAYVKQQATETASTRTMQEATKPLGYLADRVQADLNAVKKGDPRLVQQADAAIADVKSDDIDPTTDQGLNTLQARYRSALASRGITDPAYIKYMTDVNLLQTMLMRMHVGARGGEYIMGHFAETIDAHRQSSANMEAVLDSIRGYADFVRTQEGQYNFDDAWNKIAASHGLAPTGGAGAPGAPVRITAGMDISKLPKGTRVVDENGRTGTVQ